MSNTRPLMPRSSWLQSMRSHSTDRVFTFQCPRSWLYVMALSHVWKNPRHQQGNDKASQLQAFERRVAARASQPSDFREISNRRRCGWQSVASHIMFINILEFVYSFFPGPGPNVPDADRSPAPTSPPSAPHAQTPRRTGRHPLPDNHTSPLIISS